MNVYALLVERIKQKGVSEEGAREVIKKTPFVFDSVQAIDPKPEMVSPLLTAYMSLIKVHLMPRYYRAWMPSRETLPCYDACRRGVEGGPVCDRESEGSSLDVPRCMDYRDGFKLRDWVNEADSPLPFPLKSLKGSSGIIVYPFLVKWRFKDGWRGEFAEGLKEEKPESGIYLLNIDAYNARDAMLQAHIRIEDICWLISPLRGVCYGTITEIIPNIQMEDES